MKFGKHKRAGAKCDLFNCGRLKTHSREKPNNCGSLRLWDSRHRVGFRWWTYQYLCLVSNVIGLFVRNSWLFFVLNPNNAFSQLKIENWQYLVDFLSPNNTNSTNAFHNSKLKAERTFSIFLFVDFVSDICLCFVYLFIWFVRFCLFYIFLVWWQIAIRTLCIVQLCSKVFQQI